MPLQSIQLCHIDPSNRSLRQFMVTANSDDGNKAATFACSGEHDARVLRDAIREHADRLVHVHDYSDRDRPAPAHQGRGVGLMPVFDAMSPADQAWARKMSDEARYQVRLGFGLKLANDDAAAVFDEACAVYLRACQAATKAAADRAAGEAPKA